MSAGKPQSKTLLFDDPSIKQGEQTVAVVTFSSSKIGKYSNSLDLRDEQGNTVVTLTWPSKYKPREI